MKFKTFFWFVAPSLFMMLLFIAAPLVSVFIQSFQVTQPVNATGRGRDLHPRLPDADLHDRAQDHTDHRRGHRQGDHDDIVGGLAKLSNVLQMDKVWAAIGKGAFRDILQIDFWKALRFTLMFTLLTLPLVIGVGLMIALVVNNAAKSLKGPVIFVSLLPFIITPVIGSLSIYWLFVGDGILTATLERWTGQDIAMFAQAWTIELLMYFYRVWHVAPFAFVIFYAGLQTVNMDTLESAIIDGASRFERLRYVIVPHLMPLIIFIALIHLMDCYRTFEEIVGFRSQAHVISLQWLTYDFMVPDDAGNRAISRASASAMLTMIGIVILLILPLRRTWRDHKGARTDVVSRRETVKCLAKQRHNRSRLKWPLACSLRFWCLLAAFPILWIAVMSVKSPRDAFAASGVGCDHRAFDTRGGQWLSIIDIVLGLAFLFFAVRWAFIGCPNWSNAIPRRA